MIALIDGSRRDAECSRVAFQNAGHAVVPLVSGEDALDYFEGRGCYEDRVRYPLPALIVMDLDLPMMTGFAVMRWLRERSEFTAIPVALLTSSRRPSDLQTAYALGAQSYTIKASPDRLDCAAEIRAILG